MPISVVLVDDHQLIRTGLRQAFEATGDFVVLQEAGSIAAGKAAISEAEPDVAVVDIGLPDGDGLGFVRELRDSYPSLGIVVLTMYADDEHLFAALEAGASAFVPKRDPSDRVVAAARHAASAPTAFSASDLATAMQRRMHPEGVRLSARENEVLTLLAEGLTTTAIAKRLFISESTAKSHLARLYEKLSAANRTQAVMNAVNLGLLRHRDPPD